MDSRLEVTVDAPAEAAWRALGDQFGEIAVWAAPIIQSDLEGQVGVGAIRSCHVAGFGPVAPGVVREKLIDYDPEHIGLRIGRRPAELHTPRGQSANRAADVRAAMQGVLACGLRAA